MLKLKAWVLVYEDEDVGPGDPGDAKPDLKTLIDKHGLQDELNTMMAANRKGLTQKNQELVTQLTQLKDKSSMSTQAKEELEARIEELQTQFMSKEEIARRESEKSTKAHATEIEKLTGAAKGWQKLYASSTTQRALMDASVAGEALPQAVAQICSILGPSTHIVEEVDGTGQGKGAYATVVKFNDTDADGNPVVLDLSPKKAVERMRELPELYGNLFKGDGTSGLGGGNTGSVAGEKTPKLKDLLADPVKYRAWRKKNPDLDLSKLR